MHNKSFNEEDEVMVVMKKSPLFCSSTSLSSTEVIASSSNFSSASLPIPIPLSLLTVVQSNVNCISM
jgi:hypothetical protein